MLNAKLVKFVNSGKETLQVTKNLARKLWEDRIIASDSDVVRFIVEVPQSGLFADSIRVMVVVSKDSTNIATLERV